METRKIRKAVKGLAPSLRSIWPNGLGFNWRGWEYSFRDDGYWSAFKDKAGTPWIGRGETPTDAKVNAYPHPKE